MNAKRTICVTAALLVVCAFSSHTPEETNAVARAMLERAAFGWNDDLTDGGPWMGGARVFAGCGPATVAAGEIEHSGGNAFMCASSLFAGGLAVKAGKFTISNSGYLSLSTSTKDSAYGVRYVVGAGGLSFGDGATESAFYQNALQNKVRIDPAADYALGVNPARERAAGDNLAFMCHESTTYFGTTDCCDGSLPRTVTFEGGIGADALSGRNVVVDMNALTRGLLERVGSEEAAKFFTASSGFGATDFTHPVPAGADAFARLFVAEVKARRLKVSGLFRENCDIQISGHRNCVAKKYLL